MLASPTTMRWNVPSKAWAGGATRADASPNRRMTVRLGPDVAFTQAGIAGFDGPIEAEALRLYGLPEDAAALFRGTPTLPVGLREFMAEIGWDLLSPAPGVTSLLGVTFPRRRQRDLAHAALPSSTRIVALGATA